MVAITYSSEAEQPKPPSKLLLFVPAIVLKSPRRDHPALRARKTFLVAACQKLEWF
jgi:hypothetical protein